MHSTINLDEVDGATNWDRLPLDLLESIFGKLWTGDRVRFRLVCKSWNCILKQSYIPVALEAPWEILSDDSYDNPESYQTQVCFRSLSENRNYRFNLPFFHELNTNKGWVLAHSQGWLVVAMGDNMDPDLFLWNPLSKATRKLPPFSTLPFFHNFQYEDCGKEVENFSSITWRIEIFSIGPVECVVAALLGTYRGTRIALCTPREEKWIPFNFEPVDEEQHEDLDIEPLDILFNTLAGKLMVLAKVPSSIENSKYYNRDISLMECQIKVILVIVECDEGPMEVQVPHGFQIARETVKDWTMVESSVSPNLLIISAKRVTCENKNCGKGLIPQFSGSQTVEFSLLSYKPMVSNKEAIFLGSTSSNKEAIFLGSTGSFSFPVVQPIVPDCIYFAIDNAIDFGDSTSIDPYMVRERGCYLPTQMMHLETLRTIKYPTSSKVGWFLPRLFMM